MFRECDTLQAMMIPCNLKVDSSSGIFSHGEHEVTNNNCANIRMICRLMKSSFPLLISCGAEGNREANKKH